MAATEGDRHDELTPIGIGMVGYSFCARAHVSALRRLSYSLIDPQVAPRLVALAGRDGDHLEAARHRFGFEVAYTDWRDLVRDPRVEVFDNVAANDIHMEATVAAALAGRHVICEKPLARDRDEAKRMLEVASEAGVLHGTCFNCRFFPAVLLARELIQSGQLGRILHFRAIYLQEWALIPDVGMSWRFDKTQAGSGAVGDIGSHIVDLARFLVGEPHSVLAATRRFVPERMDREGKPVPVTVDDAFATIVEFENGALGTIEASRACAGRKNHQVIEVNGTCGSLYFELERLNELHVTMDLDPAKGEPRMSGFRRILVTEQAHPLWSNWWPPGHAIGWEHSFVHLLDHFLRAVATRGSVGPIGPTFEDGYRNAAICDAILQSAEKQARVLVKY